MSTPTEPATYPEEAMAAPRTIHVKATPVAATFYRNKAQIQRQAPVSFAEAYDEVQVYVPLPKVFDRDSLQVQVDAVLADKVVLRGVSFDTVDVDCLQDDGFVALDAAGAGAAATAEDVTSESRRKALRDALREVEKKIQLNSIAETEAKARGAFIESMSSKSLGVDDGCAFHGSAALWEVGTWQQQLDTLTQTRLQQRRTLRRLAKEAHQLREEQSRLQGDLGAVNAVWRHRDEEKRLNVAVVVLRVLRASPEPGCLFVSYMVPSGNWGAAYDVHLATSTNEVTLYYNAEVRLHDGEDLNDVHVTLSSAAPRQSGTQPELGAWHCGITRPVVSETRLARGRGGFGMVPGGGMAMMAMSADAMYEKAVPESAPMAIQQAAVQESATGIANFDIPSVQTIKANGEPVRVPLAVIKMSAAIAYIVVPSKQPAAYARATVANESEYLLLDGEAAIFTDGDFVCKTFLGRTAVEDKLDIDFGVDSLVCVKRVLLNSKRRTQRGGKWVTHTAYKTTIENKKKVAVDVKVQERVPMSNDAQLVVRLLEPAQVATDEQKRLLEADGHVEVDLRVSAGQTVNFPFSYEIEAPEGKPIFGL